MAEQASCIDCGFHHDPLVCYFRKGRKERLAREIKDKKQELADLEAYERERQSGKLTFRVNPMGGSHQRHYT